MTTGLIYDPIFLEHITPSRHPDRPERLEMVFTVLKALDWLERDGLVQMTPRAATVAELAAVHEPDYIQEVEQAAHNAAAEEARGGRKTHFFATDTYVSAKSYEAALKASGKRYRIYMYPGVNHAFNNDTGNRYDKAAADLAWSRTIAFFKENLGAPPRA